MKQEFNGTHASAIAFAEGIEESAQAQIRTFLNHEAFAGARICIMPDVHAGVGAVIGYTATLTDKIVPNVIGVDIGCGVSAWRLGARNDMRMKFDKLDKFVRNQIPSGQSVRGEVHSELEELWERINQNKHGSFSAFVKDIHGICAQTTQNSTRVMNSIGSLGGGNHFIEIDVASDHSLWLTIHSGSRNFGFSIAKYHQDKAVEACGKMGGLEFLGGDAALLYSKHMQTAQHFAQLSRAAMASLIIEEFFDIKMYEVDYIDSVHNYINFEDKIVRKGAISAHEGERVVIPWNMRDGLIIGVGKGNVDWNCSAPHGAGRKLGRKAAKERLSLDEFQKTMRGIWTSCISEDTLDESPMAYKNVKHILPVLGETVDVQLTLKPVYNFKAAE